ncbi:MAG: serine/threonine-protein kinase [Lysobacteraceae bacterium]
MTDYARAKSLFLAALGQPEADRRDWLQRECGSDARLLAEVESLLMQAASQPEADLLDADPESAAPSIPGYRLLHRLARGGMGEVWLAERSGDDFRQQVAIKRMGTGILRDRDAQARFRVERQILASLDHPNIARLLDGGSSDDGLPYLVMEYVEGERIDAWCRSQALGARGVVELMTRVARALQAAHQQLVVHRDLKPGNVLVDRHGEPKLLDFGIAKLLDGDAFGLTRADTRTGAQLLTPRYAAPEQVRGEAIGTAADIYAFGVLLYELLSGESPYGAAVTTLRLPAAVCDDEPAPPSQRLAQRTRRPLSTTASHIESRQLRGDLDAIVLKCLRKQPAGRYAGMGELIADLDAWQQGGIVAARRGSRAYRLRRFVRRHWFGLAVAAGVLLLTMGFLFQLSRQLEATRIERDRATLERDKANRVTGFMVDLLKSADPSRALGEEVSVREALDRGVARLDEGFDDYPALKSHLLARLSAIYLQLGDNRKGLALARQSVAELELLDSVDSAPRLSADYALAYAMEVNDVDRADVIQRYRSLLSDARAVDDDATAEIVLDRLATLLLVDEQPEEAARIFHELRALLLRRLGLDSAAQALKQVKPLAQAKSPEDKRRSRQFEWLAVNAHNLCRLSLQQDRLDDAEAECKLARALKLTLYPPLHPAHLSSEVVLSHITEKRGDMDATIAAQRQVLDMTARTYGDDHYRSAYMRVNLASTLTRVGDLDAAEALFTQALAVLDAKLGVVHRDTLESRLLYANLLLKSGDHVQLATTLGAVREAASTNDQLKNYQAAADFVSARSLWRQGRHEEARQLAKLVRSSLRDTGVGSVTVGDIVSWLDDPSRFEQGVEDADAISGDP